MAEICDKKLSYKTYLLTAHGKHWGECGPLVLSQETNKMHDGLKEIELCEFDVSSVRYGFNSSDAAHKFLRKAKKSGAIIPEYKQFGFDDVKLRELKMDIFAVDFDDIDHEKMSVMGALDCLTSQQKSIFLSAFPQLEGLTIANPQYPPEDIPTGYQSTYASRRYLLNSSELRKKFEDVASGKVEDFPSAGDAYSTFSPGRNYKCGLAGVAEEIGKYKIGQKEDNLTEVFYVRVYDVNDIRPVEPPVDYRSMAREVLNSSDNGVFRAIKDWLQMDRAETVEQPTQSGLKNLLGRDLD